jgi:hypothetical protein
MFWTLKLSNLGHSQRKKYEYCLVSIVFFPTEFPGVPRSLGLFKAPAGVPRSLGRFSYRLGLELKDPIPVERGDLYTTYRPKAWWDIQKYETIKYASYEFSKQRR